MNKYVAWIMCGVLAVGAMIFSNTKTVIAGKGDGKSEEVSTVHEVGMVLNSLGEDLHIDRVSTTESFGGTSLLNTIDTANRTGNIARKYNSVSLSFRTVAGQKLSLGLNSSSMDMEKEMECYLTKKEAYYVIDALIKTSSSAADGRRSGATMSLACELYVTSKKALMRITRYSATMINGEAPEMPSGILNKWVDMKGEASSIMSVNDDNYKVMAIIGKYILETDGEKFKKSGNTYELGNLWAQQLCGEILDISTSDSNDFKKAEFSVDLSSKTSPYLTLLYSMHKESGYGEQKYYMEAGQYMTCRLSNINNTEIRFPSNVEVYQISDFE